ncbi:uncharacterized protein K441DRAFT_661692, partial [Cenococcum geophilum 1.58]|uniref:uncharacterized protein n=1 Tax=Cenococcum geophilum 1.58 TaxID=794803 RepID=UPI003590221B
FNKANDEVYISRLRREFYSTIFDPIKIQIIKFLSLTNDDIKEQLLLALLSDITWQNTKT